MADTQQQIEIKKRKPKVFKNLKECAWQYGCNRHTKHESGLCGHHRPDVREYRVQYRKEHVDRYYQYEKRGYNKMGRKGYSSGESSKSDEQDKQNIEKIDVNDLLQKINELAGYQQNGQIQVKDLIQHIQTVQ